MQRRRSVGAVGGQSGAGVNRNAHWSQIDHGGPLVDPRRRATHTGLQHHVEQADLNDTERLVYRVLDDELVSAKEIAGFAGITVEECRRALATLRTLGMADAERRGQVNAWRRA